ncbi:MAG: ComEC/Rec2 family competence protein, partial [Mailhella sp.]|nr:ComEC/Rec2 family competence protein [Mailhella sp.]
MPDAAARILKPCLLPALLGWQTGLLAMLAGAVAWRAPAFAAALMALLAVVPGLRDLRRLALLLLCFCLGAAMMRASLPRQEAMPSWAAMPGRTVLAAGTVRSFSGLYGGRVRLLLEHVRPLGGMPALPADRQEKLSRQLARDPLFAGSGFPKGYAAVTEGEGEIPGLVALTLDARDLGDRERPLPGQDLRGALRFFPSGGSLNEHVSDSRLYWHDRDVWCSARPARSGGEPLWMEASGGSGLCFHAARMRERWRLGLLETLRRVEERRGAQSEGEDALSQSSAMLLALLFGDRSGLSPQTADRFASAGLVHSLALSGQHLALAGLVGAASVWLCSLLFRGMFLRAPRRVWVACAALPFAVCYLYLGGAPFSLLRAACMLAAGAALLCMRRASSPLDALFFAGALLFIGWPPGVFDLSLQLSFSAVAGIICAAPLLGFVRAKLLPGAGTPRGLRSAC